MEIITPPEPKESTEKFEQKIKKLEAEPQTGEETFAKPPVELKREDPVERKNKIQKVFQEIMLMFKRLNQKDESPSGGNSWFEPAEREVPRQMSGSDHERFMKPKEEKILGEAPRVGLPPSTNEKLPGAKEEDIPPGSGLN